MKSSTPGPNRLTRISAKEVPHRTDERFFAAKADVKNDPLFVLTSQHDWKSVCKYFTAEGFDYFLPKPWDFKVLYQVI